MSEFAIKSATLTDVHAIMTNLSDVCRAELNTITNGNWWSAIGTVKKFLNAGPAEALYQDDKPIAVLGHFPHAVYYRSRVTWFLATEALFALGATGVRMGRRYVANMRRAWPDETIYVYSRSEHPGAARWFTLLGFEDRGFEAGCRLFVLPTKPQQGAGPEAA